MKLIPSFKYLTLLFIFTTTNCEETIVGPTFKMGQESTFRIGRLYTSSDGQYTLQINEINDSRCPEGVQCVWQGEVSLKGQWTHNKLKSDFELHSVLKDMERQPEGFTIQLIKATPYPSEGTESRPENLLVTLLVQENNSKLDTISISPSMKGWELYSWPTESDWKYSILIGTNRNKTYQEVLANKISVVGKDSLKRLLDKFPANEQIFWSRKPFGDDWGNISLPDDNTINEIKDYCTQKKLVLTVVK